jgi:hypothetical protein
MNLLVILIIFIRVMKGLFLIFIEFIRGFVSIAISMVGNGRL